MSDKPLLLERHDDVAVIRLDRGVTNAIDLEVVHALENALREVARDPACIGLVLTSSNDKFLSIGFDIPNLLPLSESDFAAFFRSFNEMCLDLFLLAKPTAAAITGHAIAGGCILALGCDYRMIAEGRKLMGLNEIRLGVPVPYFADCVLRSLVGWRNARMIMETGDFFPAKEALELGLVDQVFPQEDVLHHALEKVRALGRTPGRAYSLIKGNRVEPIALEVRRGLEKQEKSFLEAWYSEPARTQLKQAASRF